MKPRGDRDYLQFINESLRLIEERLQGITRDEFLASYLIHDAVGWRLFVIGQASADLSDDFRKAHAEIDWSSLIATCRQVVTDYRAFRAPEFWEAANVLLPPLRVRVPAWLLEFEQVSKL